MQMSVKQSIVIAWVRSFRKSHFSPFDFFLEYILTGDHCLVLMIYGALHYAIYPRLRVECYPVPTAPDVPDFVLHGLNLLPPIQPSSRLH